MRGFTLATTTALTATAITMKESPMRKIINLLTDMKNNLISEEDADKSAFDKIMCWVKSTRKEQEQIESENKALVAQLDAEIESTRGNTDKLKSETKTLQEDIKRYDDSRKSNNVNCQKQSNELNEDIRSGLTAEKQLEGALVVLKGSSFSQTAVSDIKKVIANPILQQQQSQLAESASNILMNLMQDADDGSSEAASTAAGDAKGTGKPAFKSYNRQSGRIVGILEQMLTTQKKNLAENKQELDEKTQNCDKLNAQFTAQLKGATTQYDSKMDQLGNAETRLAEAKVERRDAGKAYDNAVAMLGEIKVKEEATQKDMDARTKARSVEKAAMADAINMLSSDSSFKTFTKDDLQLNQMNFLQLKSIHKSQTPVDRARSILSKHDMSFLATMVETHMTNEQFERVFKEMDNMAASLAETRDDEVDQKDSCIKDQDENAIDTQKANQKLDDLAMQIDVSDHDIEKYNKKITNKKQELSNLATSSADMTKDRKEENNEFQAGIAEQKATAAILEKVINRLAQGYEQEETDRPSLVSVKSDDEDDIQLLQLKSQTQAPPAAMKKYEAAKMGSGPLAMLRKILNDAKGTSQELSRSEQDSQIDYEKQMKSNYVSNEDANLSLRNYQGKLADQESNNAQLTKEEKTTDKTKKDLVLHGYELSKTCAFILNNFDMRQNALTQEIQAIKQAKAILQGAKVA